VVFPELLPMFHENTGSACSPRHEGLAVMDEGRELARQAGLDALHLDEFAETAYDDLVRVAADLCQTPMALVSITATQRQWFKARIGIPVHEIPRELAFCNHAVLQGDEVLVIEDASRDPRFSSNPFVTGPPHLRFYAGAPLVTSGGHAIGTVCVLDTTPRTISSEQVEELRFLARQVIDTLEARKAAADGGDTEPGG
jgi:GAF domain-containing protein